MAQIIECRVGDEVVLLHVDEPTGADKSGNPELWRAETYTTKEPDTLAWIDAFFREGDVIYDVGANIGQYSALRRQEAPRPVHRPGLRARGPELREAQP